MTRHLPDVHAYADDNQLYISFKPGSSASELEAVAALPDCILDIKTLSRGDTGVKFCWVCAAGISEPLPHYILFLVYFVANYKPHLSHVWANDFLTLKVPKKCDPILVTLLKMFEKATPL